MLLTTDFKRGDIVLVNFVFSDETASKRRPVLLLSSERYMEGRQEVIVAAITSNTRRLLEGDHLMFDCRTFVSVGHHWNREDNQAKHD
jgi:hypothetical protein